MEKYIIVFFMIYIICGCAPAQVKNSTIPTDIKKSQPATAISNNPEEILLDFLKDNQFERIKDFSTNLQHHPLGGVYPLGEKPKHKPPPKDPYFLKSDLNSDGKDDIAVLALKIDNTKQTKHLSLIVCFSTGITYKCNVVWVQKNEVQKTKVYYGEEHWTYDDRKLRIPDKEEIDRWPESEISFIVEEYMAGEYYGFQGEEIKPLGSYN